MSNEINIDELEQFAKAAWRGPWHRQDFYAAGDRTGVDSLDGDSVCTSFGRGYGPNFDYIAAAYPDAILSLIGRLKTAESSIAALIRNLELTAQERDALAADESWDDIKLAEMLMSDCGFSSRYAPLKERIAKRIAKHVAAKTNPQAKGD